MSLKSFTFAGDYINGKFVKADKPDGQYKDISPADLSDQIMTVSYQLDHVDAACKAAKTAYLPWAKLSLNER
jgi:succinylglutamic semialdehyde dehydrogenase